MKCSCGEKAIYFRRCSGQSFCRKHFIEDFERKVVRAITRKKMFGRGEKVGVALSGGKDSTVALHLINELSKKFALRVCAIVVDEGIAGYRSKTVAHARKFCKKHNIPIYIEKFGEKLGITLDDVMKSRKNACTYCGVFRRKLLNEKAAELKLDKLVIGHNLDDTAQAILMNHLRGDVNKLVRLEHKQNGKFVPRIKPLEEMPEKEVALYALLKKFEVGFDECQYAADTFRTYVKDFINDMENKNPGIKFSIFQGYTKLLPHLKNYKIPEMSECEVCGEPSSQEVCKACELLEEIRAVV